MKLARWTGVLLIGGISFWIPTVTIEIATKRGLDPAIGTIVPLGAVLLAYFFIRRAGRALWTKWASLWMLAGIYVLGPLMMSIGESYLGGSGLSASALPMLVVASLVPLFTLYLAGYDATVFGVVLATGALIFIHVRFERRRAAVGETGSGEQTGTA